MLQLRQWLKPFDFVKTALVSSILTVLLYSEAHLLRVQKENPLIERFINIFIFSVELYRQKQKDLKTCTNKSKNWAIWHNPLKRTSHVHTSGLGLKISQHKFPEFIKSSQNLNDNLRYRSAFYNIKSWEEDTWQYWYIFTSRLAVFVETSFLKNH